LQLFARPQFHPRLRSWWPLLGASSFQRRVCLVAASETVSTNAGQCTSLISLDESPAGTLAKPRTRVETGSRPRWTRVCPPELLESGCLLHAVRCLCLRRSKGWTALANDLNVQECCTSSSMLSQLPHASSANVDAFLSPPMDAIDSALDVKLPLQGSPRLDTLRDVSTQIVRVKEMPRERSSKTRDSNGIA
jgi:hypothetical protein